MAARVVIAVLTFRRPDSLARIVPLLAGEARRTGPNVSILVVDNDPDAGARAVVAAQEMPGLDYVHEPVPGIAAARNRALEEARACGARAIAFIDDDEEPTVGWLAALLGQWQRARSTAVTGPVEPVYAGPVDAWVLASGRFARRTHPTGTVRPSAASNNLLLDLDAITELNLSFDLSFGLTGGEDTLLTHTLTDRGGVITWSEEALVRDHIPLERMTRHWVLRREFRSGTSYARMVLVRSVDHRRAVSVRVDLVTRGLVRATGALMRWAWGLACGNVTHQARGACRAAANAGLIAGALGHRYREYRR